MDKIVCCEPHDEKDQDAVAKLQKQHGTYNDFPPGWRRITEAEFVGSRYFGYTPQFTEHRQMCRPPQHMTEGHMLGAVLYFFDDGTGVAVEAHRPPHKYNEKRPVPVVRYYAFGCAHEYREMSMAECKTEEITHNGNCWHVFLCEKCGQVNAYDSSD